MTMKEAVFWVVTPHIYCINRRFGGTYHLHLQDRKIREGGPSVSRWLQTADSSYVSVLNDFMSHMMKCLPRSRSATKQPFREMINCFRVFI
jgi:hypothetical protein